MASRAAEEAFLRHTPVVQVKNVANSWHESWHVHCVHLQATHRRREPGVEREWQGVKGRRYTEACREDAPRVTDGTSEGFWPQGPVLKQARYNDR